MTKKPDTIDAYLATVDDSKRATLQKLREMIHAAAPDAEEGISYSLPTFRHGRIVCGFGATEKHCAFYVYNEISLDPFAEALKDHDIGNGTIRFPPEKPLPADLVCRLVKARLAENDVASQRSKG